MHPGKNQTALFLIHLSSLLILIVSPGCSGRKPAVAIQPKISTPAISPANLLQTLDAIFDHPDLQNAFWGVMIQSLDTGEVLYRHNAEKLFLPASNMKLFTGAAALVQLGKDYRFQTRLLALGPIENGVLHGSLLVEGGGDPTISSRFYPEDSLKVFKDWATELKAAGLREIRGDILGDDDRFEDLSLGAGWAWDDVSYAYSAEIGALQCNENVIGLTVKPGTAVGEKVSVELSPPSDYVQLEIQATTCRAEEEPGLSPERNITDNRIRLKGCLPLKSNPSRLNVAVHDPTAFFVHLLRRTLILEGIPVTGRATDLDELKVKPDKKSATQLLLHTSPPLENILTVLLKESQNLYAETLIRIMGLESYEVGSFAAGRRAASKILQQMAITESSYVMSDGSGMSRYNLLSPEQLVRLLRFMYRREDFPLFYRTLPIAGVDGTLAGRLRGTTAEKKVHAKTGSMSNVRSLSGYIRTAEGEMLAFSMIANHFTASHKQVEYHQDLALELLAGWKRRQERPPAQ